MYRWMKKGKKYFGLLLLFLCLCSGGFFSGHTVYAGTNLWNYGDQLTGIAKEIYTGLQKVPDMKAYYGIISNGKLTSGKALEIKLSKSYSYSQYNQIFNETAKATDAFLRDRSDIFWISGLACEVRGNRYTNKFDTVRLYPKDYYDGIRSEIKSTQNALKRAINYVKKQKGRYAKVKAAHNYIANLVSYSRNDTESLCYHTITGGLLDKYKHTGVCETYAKLFDIICKANNIPSILVTNCRIYGNQIYSNDHIWNYVQMENGKWYVVDVTYDDQDSSREILYDYFLAGSNTNVWGEKVKETHLGTGYCIASLYAYSPFKLPTLAKKRFSNKSKNK